MKVTGDQRLPPDLFFFFFDPRWCLTGDDANQISKSMHTFMESIRLQDGTESAASFNPLVEPPKKKQKKEKPDPVDTVPNRQATSLLESLRSNNPHQYGGSREEVIEESNPDEPGTLLMQDLVRITIAATENEVGDFVNLCYEFTRRTTNYDGSAYCFAITRKLLEQMEFESDEMESDMCRAMHKHRPDPSMTLWLEQWLINHVAFENGAVRACRVHPCIGHIVWFQDSRACSQVAMQTYSGYVSESRWDHFGKNAVQGDPRDFSGVYTLSKHNQVGGLKPLTTLDFKILPTNPNEDRDMHHWITYVDRKLFHVIQPGIRSRQHIELDEPYKIHLDGVSDCELYGYKPWIPFEKGKHGEVSTRMRRTRRKAVLDFCKRTFSKDRPAQVRAGVKPVPGACLYFFFLSVYSVCCPCSSMCPRFVSFWLRSCL